MTPREKAKELFDKLEPIQGWDRITEDTPDIKDRAKQCALICVEEIIEAFPCPEEYGVPIGMYNYWLDVKAEIEKL